MLKKSLEFVLSRRDSIFAFNLSLILLPAKIDLISEKQSYKKDMLITHGISRVKIILALLTKVIALYMWVFIIQVKILDLKVIIIKCEIGLKLAIFLISNKQF